MTDSARFHCLYKDTVLACFTILGCSRFSFGSVGQVAEAAAAETLCCAACCAGVCCDCGGGEVH